MKKKFYYHVLLPVITTYTVTFDLNNHGTGLPELQILPENSLVTLPTNPSDPTNVYLFGGWFTDSACTGYLWAFDNDTVTLNITLYAKWLNKSISVNVEFNVDPLWRPEGGGYQWGFLYTENPNSPVSEFEFGGIMAPVHCDSTVLTCTRLESDRWQKPRLYDGNYYKKSDSNSKFYVGDNCVIKVRLNTSAQQTCELVGFSINTVNAGRLVEPLNYKLVPLPYPTTSGSICPERTEYSYIYEFILTGDTVITPLFRLNQTYTVTYDANGGTGTMTDPNSPYHSGATVTTLTNSFTRSGYGFNGWNTAADGSGISYAAGETFGILSDTVLYALWSQQYIINYYHTNYNGSGTSTEYYYLDDLPYSLMEVDKETGYTFDGWYDNDQYTGNPITEITTAGDKVFYGKWHINTYKLSFLVLNAENTVFEINTDANGNDYEILYDWNTNRLNSEYNYQDIANRIMAVANLTESEYASITEFYKKSTEEHMVMYNGSMIAEWGNDVDEFIDDQDSENGYIYLYGSHAGKGPYQIRYLDTNAESGTAPKERNLYGLNWSDSSMPEWALSSNMTILGNTGDLLRTGYLFGGWTINGQHYNVGDSVTVSESLTSTLRTIILEPYWIPINS